MSLIIATASIAPGSENSNSVIGKWKVNSNFGIYEQSRQAEFAFKDDGTFIVDSNSGYTGTWTQSGDAIHLEYLGGRAVYDGTIKSNTISGTMQNIYLSVGGSWTATKEENFSNAGIQQPTSQVALILGIRSLNGRFIQEAQITGQDGSGNNLDVIKTPSYNGYATIAGNPGTWSLTVSAPGFETKSWSQDITTNTDSQFAFLQPVNSNPGSNSDLNSDSTARDRQYSRGPQASEGGAVG